MLTSQKLMKDCPLSEYSDIPHNLNYFSSNRDCYNCYQDGISLWKDKKYFLFFLTIGSIFEFILFEMAHSATVELYRQSKQEHKLPKNHLWITSSRGDRDNLSNVVAELTNKDQSYITNGSFYNKDTLWTELQCLKYVLVTSVDKTTYDTLVRHLIKIKECRNSFTHGNLQGFYKKLYPKHYFHEFISFDISNPNEFRTEQPLPISENPNRLILIHMFGSDRKTIQPYIQKDFVDVYIQAAHILDFVSQELNELNDKNEIEHRLIKILPQNNPKIKKARVRKRKK